MPDTKVSSPTELLAPAGDWECLRAAVAAGADAVYFGLPRFSARARAANFRPDELAAVMDFLRARNVRGYVAFNTLVFSEELEAAAGLIADIAAAGCDAVIVQDPGLARLARRMVPTLAIHASTQMSLAEPRGIELARRELGVSRVILPRELSLGQIRLIAAAVPGAELEVFVHGALCISYSGQCLASLTMGGRSGNRGECAQPCRLPYGLRVEGGRWKGEGAGADAPVPPSTLNPQPPTPNPQPSTRPYPLSPKDLSAWELVPELVGLGAAGLKIEGRLKGPEYVRTVTAFYRRALDAALAGQPFAPSADDLAALAQGFSRGFTRGHLAGTNHRDLVEGLSPKPRGVRVGTVAGRTARGVVVALEGGIRPGDGLVIVPPEAGGAEVGGRVFGVRPQPEGEGGGGARLAELTFGPETGTQGVAVGSVVWKTDDPALEKRLAREHAERQAGRKTPISVRVRARLGGDLRMVFRDSLGHEAEAFWPGPLTRAEKHPLSEQLLREQLGRLGDTPFELGAVDAAGIGPVMVPKSVLNDLRRQAVAGLLELRSQSARHAVAEPEALGALLASAPTRNPEPGRPALSVLVRTREQLDAVTAWAPGPGAARPALVYCDLPEAGQLAGAVAAARAAGLSAGLATPQVIEPGEDRLLEAVAEARPDVVLVRNLAAVGFFRAMPGAPELVGDLPLNAANELSGAWLAGLGLTLIAPAADLDRERIEALAADLGPERLEIVVRRHAPMFHTKHCLVAAALSRGGSCADCGRPCGRARIALRDRKGVVHQVLVDAAGRSTVYGGTELVRMDLVPGWLRQGIRRFRVEMLDEDARAAAALLARAARAFGTADEPR